MWFYVLFLKVLIGQDKNHRISGAGWDLQESLHPTCGPVQDGLWSKLDRD